MVCAPFISRFRYVYVIVAYFEVIRLDARTRGTVATLTDTLGGADALRDTTGLPLSTYFSGIKLRWLLDNVPAVKDAAGRGMSECHEGRGISFQH